MRRLVIALMLLASLAAQAGCIANDAWTGPDKTKHFLGGAVLGAGATLVLRNPHKGFLFGAGVGAAKEIADVRGWIPGSRTCSLQDFVITAAGAAAGAYGAGWLILPRRGGLFVAYVNTF